MSSPAGIPTICDNTAFRYIRGKKYPAGAEGRHASPRTCRPSHLISNLTLWLSLASSVVADMHGSYARKLCTEAIDVVLNPAYKGPNVSRDLGTVASSLNLFQKEILSWYVDSLPP